ncbi:MAG: dTMP kinase [Gammaproteobacteria bacterium]|nr:dTMP kinase [Gammaproteobacteria bacterium]
MQQAKFITLEGIEGVGKSSNLIFLLQLLKEKNIPFCQTREPGGTPLGEQLRALLLAPTEQGMGSNTELLLMFAARAEHLHALIQPELKKGNWVVSDRFTDASYAYQGGGRGISKQRILALEAWLQEGFQPDLTLLLDAPPEVGLARVSQRGASDRFEQEQVSFFQRVREAYLERAEREPERFRLINADQPLFAVQAEIKAALMPFLSRAV